MSFDDVHSLKKLVILSVVSGADQVFCKRKGGSFLKFAHKQQKRKRNQPTGEKNHCRHIDFLDRFFITYFLLKSCNINDHCNKNNSLVLYSASGPQALSKRFTDKYYYPSHWIQANPHTIYAHSPLPVEHSSQASFLQAHTCSSNHIKYRILPGTHLTPGWRVANVDQCLAKGN